MPNVPAPDQIASLRREYEDPIQQHPHAGGVMERMHVVLTNIAHLAACTLASVGESRHECGGDIKKSAPAPKRK
jgi:hypothetical protein